MISYECKETVHYSNQIHDSSLADSFKSTYRFVDFEKKEAFSSKTTMLNTNIFISNLFKMVPTVLERALVEKS